jgi:hypothetical protein
MAMRVTGVQTCALPISFIEKENINKLKKKKKGLKMEKKNPVVNPVVTRSYPVITPLQPGLSTQTKTLKNAIFLKYIGKQ